MRAVLARIGRGYARIWRWVKKPFHVKHEGSPGQLDQERETAVSLGLMAEAASAGGQATDDQRIFLSQSAAGMRARMDVLLRVPNRSLAQERELQMIDRELARIEGRPASEPVPVRVMGFASAPQSLVGALGGVRLWMILAAGWAVTGGALAVQSALKERIEDQRDEARRIARDNAEAAERWQERSEEYRLGLIDAANIAREAAAALEAERAAEARRAARERRRNREIANVLADSPDAPEWRLREPAATEGEPPPG